MRRKRGGQVKGGEEAGGQRQRRRRREGGGRRATAGSAQNTSTHTYTHAKHTHRHTHTHTNIHTHKRSTHAWRGQIRKTFREPSLFCKRHNQKSVHAMNAKVRPSGWGVIQGAKGDQGIDSSANNGTEQPLRLVSALHAGPDSRSARCHSLRF